MEINTYQNSHDTSYFQNRHVPQSTVGVCSVWIRVLFPISQCLDGAFCWPLWTRLSFYSSSIQYTSSEKVSLYIHSPRNQRQRLLNSLHAALLFYLQGPPSGSHPCCSSTIYDKRPLGLFEPRTSLTLVLCKFVRTPVVLRVTHFNRTTFTGRIYSASRMSVS